MYAVKNFFYIGDFQASINEGDKIKGLTEAEATERDFYVYRSYVALGDYNVVIEEIKGSNIALEAVKLLAQYMSAFTKKDNIFQESVKNTFKEWLADPAISSNNDVLLIAATIFAHEKDYNEALKYIMQGQTLEMCALCVHILLKLNKPDQAEKKLRAMQKIDEDHTLTQLANAWVNLAVGGSKVQEAFYIFKELDKFNATAPLLNGQAVCLMHMGRFEDAEKLLSDARNKDKTDPDTLANLVVCDLHLGKSYTRHMSQLKALGVSVPLLERHFEAEENFKKAMVAMEAFA